MISYGKFDGQILDVTSFKYDWLYSKQNYKEKGARMACLSQIRLVRLFSFSAPIISFYFFLRSVMLSFSGFFFFLSYPLIPFLDSFSGYYHWGQHFRCRAGHQALTQPEPVHPDTIVTEMGLIQQEQHKVTNMTELIRSWRVCALCLKTIWLHISPNVQTNPWALGRGSSTSNTGRKNADS